MLVRRLTPQEDKLDLTKLSPHDLEELTMFVGAILRRAHERGATGRRANERGARGGEPEPWTQADGGALLDRAVALAGLHEATYLAWCKLAAT
jgi:hypothetical protein